MLDPHWQPWCERPSGLVVPVPLDPTGERGPTRHMARRGRWRQTSSGKYVPSSVDGTIVEQRILEQSGRLVTYGAATGWAALRWRGAAYFDGTDINGAELPVPLIAHDKLRADPRVHLTQERLPPTEVDHLHGIPCTTVQRALFDEIRRHSSWREAVVAVEMTYAAGLISRRLLWDYVGRRGTWTGVPFAREVVGWSREGARSPQEVRFRLIWEHDAHLDPPLINQPVYDLDGRLLGIPDLLDPIAGLVGEYDGAAHRDGARHRRDVAREECFRDHGLEYFVLVGGDVRDRQLAGARMHAARERAKFLPPESRAWTLDPPPWVTPAESLDARLARLGLVDELRRF